MSNPPGISPPQRLNILLITFDSLAARNMSLYGYGKVTTPHLDAFAENSFVFKNVSANCNSTIPSMITMLTGKYPFPRNGRHLISLLGVKGRSENLPSVLKKEGYHVSAVLGNLMGYPIVSGLHFIKTVEWTNSLKLHISFWGEYLVRIFSRNLLVRWSRDVTRRTLRTNSPDSTLTTALDRLRTLRSPFFLWIHIYPPHAPYLPSSKFKYAFLTEQTLETFGAQKRYLGGNYARELQPLINKLRSRYDELILSADEAFGAFINTIKHEGYLDHSIVIVASDHGEMFEKGYQGHDGSFLYQPMIHIPLILRMPNQHAGEIITVNAGQVDIAPTILDMAGLKIPSWMEGESLKKAMERSPVRNRPNFSMSVDLFDNNGGLQAGSIAVTHEEYKLIFCPGNKGTELYDLSRDPGEGMNLVHVKKEETKLLEDMMRRKMPAPLWGGLGKH